MAKDPWRPIGNFVIAYFLAALCFPLVMLAIAAAVALVLWGASSLGWR